MLTIAFSQARDKLCTTAYRTAGLPADSSASDADNEDAQTHRVAQARADDAVVGQGGVHSRHPDLIKLLSHLDHVMR